MARTAAASHHGGSTALESERRPAGLNDRWIVLGVCVFVAAITWLVFGQTLRHEFINFDDLPYVLKNPPVARGLTLDGIVWAFTHVHSANWHPLTWISHMLDCQLYGLTPRGHHLTNVLLHATTAILLFLVLRQMTGALWRSAFVAAVFAIHPLRVESVAWVAERKDLLSGLFFMLTIGAYVRYARRPRSLARYGLVTLLFIFGLMCKPMLVTLPFVLLLLDYWPLNRFGRAGNWRENNFKILRQLIVEKLPLLGLAAASCVATLFAQISAIQPAAKLSLPLRAGNAALSYLDYLRQMLWPSDLTALYPWDVERIRTSTILLSLILLAGISVAVFVVRRRRYLLTGWLWYLVMLGPVIGIVQVGSQAHADRYTYLPQIGLYLMVTWAAADLCTNWRRGRLFLSVLSTIILASLIFSARAQTSYWQNSETLWTHTLACTSNNAIAEQNLGEAYYAQGRQPEAIARFENALLIQENQASIHASLGVAFLEIGRVQESLAHLQRALEIDPKSADAHYNLGNTYLQMGRAADAVAHYNIALEIDPDDTQAQNNLAWVLATCSDARVRDGTKAVEIAERADSLTGNKSAVITATLAAAYAEAGRSADAVKMAQRALQLAVREGNNARADSIRAQIKLYESGAAFRDRRYTPTVR